MGKLNRCALVMLLGLFAPTTVRSADLSAPMMVDAGTGEQNRWTYAVSPYFWAAGMLGDIAQFGLPAVHLDPSFSDILKNLDFAAMVVGRSYLPLYIAGSSLAA